MTTAYSLLFNYMDGFEQPITEGYEKFCLSSTYTNISDCVQTVYELPLVTKVVNCVVLHIVCV